jgi:type IV pilus assembly protein PilB
LFHYNLKIEDTPILRLLDSILEEALHRNASDIHCEPGEDGTRIRCRVDGVLQQTQIIPSFRHQPLVSVIKLLGGLDIAEKRQSQDGRAFIEQDGIRTDLRISTLPTIAGEKVVLRLLASDQGQCALDSMDWEDRTLARYRRLYQGSYGLVLVTGPTGSGKTTTLYATLAELNRAEENIITLEDPVEYRLAGVNQVAVNRRAGLTFATGLRSILRQDPDIIMVGEIRDGETASISIQSALTGHLVFSTLHTNSALGAIVRLLDMGVEPYLVTSALRGVAAQRLVRRLCTACRKAYVPAADAWERRYLQLPAGWHGTLYKPAGCPLCHGTGYRGRLAIQEVVELTPALKRQILDGAPEESLRQASRQEGVTFLAEDGRRKVLSGATSAEELLRVLGVV